MKSDSWAVIADKQKNYGDKPKRPRVSELVDVYDKKEYSKEYKTIRLYGPIKTDANHIIKGKRKLKDGTLKDVIFAVPCLNYNRETGEMEDHDCPYCKYVNGPQIRFYQNAIIREYEDNPPLNRGERTESEKQLKTIDGFKCYVKENKNTPAWTPVRIVEIPKSLTGELKKIQDFNKYRDEEGNICHASPSDLKYGVDLFIRYDAETSEPSKKYILVRDPDSGKTPITPDIRKSYLMWDLQIPPLNEEEIRKDFNNNCKIALPDASHKEAHKEYLAELEAKGEEKPAKTNKPAMSVKQVGLDDDDLDDLTPAQQAMTESNDVAFESKPSKASKSEYEDLDDSSDLDEDEFEDL